MRTTYNGQVGGSYSSLPFGDGLTVSGNDWWPYHFAGTEEDSTSNDHAIFRQYAHVSGRWMSPDPYGGSYDFTNPQSLNRYSYVMNNPLSFTDPQGLDVSDDCDVDPEDPSCCVYGFGFCIGFGFGGGGGDSGGVPIPPPGPQGPWNPNHVLTENLGMPPGMLVFPSDVAGMLQGAFGLQIPGCEFGACSVGVSGFMAGGDVSAGAEIIPLTFVLYVDAWAHAPNNGQSYSFVKQWWKDVKSCFTNYALPTLESDLNPFTPGVMSPSGMASQLSQASLAAAASWSVSRGLTVPLRSGIVRAGVANAEALGKLSGVLGMIGIDYALADAAYAEYKGCL